MFATVSGLLHERFPPSVGICLIEKLPSDHCSLFLLLHLALKQGGDKAVSSALSSSPVRKLPAMEVAEKKEARIQWETALD